MLPVDLPPYFGEYFSPRLERALLFVSSYAYARFAAALVMYPALFEIASFLLLPPTLLAPVLASLASVQSLPFILLYLRASRRKRAVEAELPFIAMLLYILSHESYPNLRDAFSRIDELGEDVFPAFHAESQALNRNLTYGTGPDLYTVEATFNTHPSEQFREFVHGYLTTLLSGRDVHEFVREEAERLTNLLEERWKAFSGMVSSMAEVAFIFLAVFPIGMQMIAGAFLSGSSSELLLWSVMLLVVVTVGLMLWMDYAQPALHDRRYPLPAVGVTVSVMCGSVGLYLLHVIGPAGTVLLGLASSLAFVFLSRGFFRSLRAGEREIAVMLHDLAEATRSGVSLPVAMSHLQDSSQRFPSLRDAISTFARLLSLGSSPKTAQKRVLHPSWLVKASFGLLAVSFETGSGYEQLEKLSLSFRKICDARRSIQSSVLPFAVLGASVPVISIASYWFLNSVQGFTLLVPGLAFQSGSVSIVVSVIATSILTGFMVSKAYSLSFRSLVGIPPILIAALLSFLFFGFA